MAITLALIPICLLLLGFPIFIVLLTASTATFVFFLHVPLSAIHQNLFGTINGFGLLAVPFFIYAGELMTRGSVARRLVDFVQAGVGGVRGGLGVTTIGTAVILGAISGVSTATVATVGKMMYPAMRRAKYPEAFSAGLVTAIGAIDIIIPPSVPMIVFGAAAQESVPRLYAAGIVPGLIIAAMLAAYAIWTAKRLNFGEPQKFSMSGFIRAAGRGIWALGMPFIILGGIYGGVFSPTEAASVACVYAAFVTFVVFRELKWNDIIESARVTVFFTAQILIIAACAGVFSWILTTQQVPAAMVTFIETLNVPSWVLLLIINILLLLVGCFLDTVSSILLLTPLLVPLANALGVDTVQFGIIMTVNLAIGLFHPPFGMNIFVAQSVLRIPLLSIYKGIVPLLFIYLFALLLVTFIPVLSMGMVDLLY